MKNPKKEVDKELNNIFGNLGQRNWIKISYILSKLQLDLVKQKEIIFKTESLLKLYLFRRIKGITYYEELLKALQEEKEEAYRLGFLNNDNNELVLPGKRYFNKFYQKHKDVKEELNNIAKAILKKASEKGIILDLEIVKKVIKQNNKKEQNRALKEATKLVKKLVYPQIDLKIKENGKFTTKDLLDVLVHIAQTHDFTHDGSVTFKELNPESKAPTSWTMLYHFSKFNDKNKIQDMFDKVLEVIFNYAKQNYNILKRRKLDIAIDIHKIPYYGDKNDPYVTEGKPERGTSHFYQFITSSIVVAGRRFTLDAVPIHKFDTLENLVDILVKKAKEKIRISKVYLDRGFDKPKVINILKVNRVKFVMPKVRSERVKAWMKKSVGVKARKIKDFEIGRKDKAVIDLILVDDDEGIKRAFITNLNIPEQLAHYLYKFYSKRWGIETSYRQMDHDFKAKTTSKNYHIRLFYFLFSVALYNLWVLVNIVVSMTLYGRIRDKPVITAKLFAVVLYRVAYEDPPT
ncbi:hypothetical protein CMI38_05065 [Candidatus Pacearchaeota archaeon]|nr:hypothetical protein [Candidatus Pacearchaeota archaeon]|tara:strand:- start:235 stop:1785 length:1551 start_codon:yes stop_codon:yes gene_type:complete